VTLFDVQEVIYFFLLIHF